MAKARNTPQNPSVTARTSDFPDFRRSETGNTCFAPGDIVMVDPEYVGQGGRGKVVSIVDTLPYPIIVELSDTKSKVAVRTYEIKRLSFHENPATHSQNSLVTSNPNHNNGSDAGEW
ncbi:MAG: hypothetical protein FWD68_14730 [Alphaproteobacteria bacterium]|nr:hypothetical protein [Alphaproteobacteria bacterium]